MVSKKVINIYIFVGIIVFIHIILIGYMGFFPYPEFSLYPYLVQSGFVPYKEIIDQHFPGVFFLPINGYHLGLTSYYGAFLWHFFIISANHFILFRILKKLRLNNLQSILGNLLYMALQISFNGNILWIESFISLLFSIALLFLISKKITPSKLVCAGTALGMALLFKQTVVVIILYVLVLIALSLKDKKSLINFSSFALVSLAFPLLVILTFVLSKDILSDFIFWTYEFNKLYPFVAAKALGRREIVYIALLILYTLFSFSKRVIDKSMDKWTLLIITGFISIGIFFVYPRSDLEHVQPALVPFVVLTTSTLFKINKNFLKLSFFAALTIFSGYMAFRTGSSTRTRNNHISISYSDEVNIRFNKEDLVYAFAVNPYFYYETKRMPPIRMYYIHLPWYLNIIEGKELELLQKDMPDGIVWNKHAMVDGKLISDYAPNIVRFIEHNYLQVGETNLYTIYKRNENRN